MTDLAHVTQLLQEAAHREHFSLPALRDWLRAQRDERERRDRTHPPAGQRRRGGADHDGVGQQGPAVPVVYLPFAFNRHVRPASCVLFHEGDTRCLHIGGADSPDYNAVEKLGRAEDASDDSRLTYVALTRAQSQVVAWWAPSCDEPNGGLSRLLRGRRPGEPAGAGLAAARQGLRRRRAGAASREWEAAGGPVHRGVRGAPDASRCRASSRPRISMPGTSTARSTPRGGGRRTRV